MKRLLLFFIFIIPTAIFSQSCLPGWTTFSNQSEIDDFLINNPGCTKIEGSITIAGDDSVRVGAASKPV
jgi:hypothetical protein